MGAHRNVFEANRILDNGLATKEGAAVIIRGHHHDLVFRNNVIGLSRPKAGGVGILHSKHAPGLKAVDNQYPHLKETMRQEDR
jgi:hypothetical protein